LRHHLDTLSTSTTYLLIFLCFSSWGWVDDHA
jgi:hypothetical protein